MGDPKVARLLEAVERVATRIMGPYGYCYCRDPYPNAALGHEYRCQQLAQAIRALRADDGVRLVSS